MKPWPVAAFMALAGALLAGLVAADGLPQCPSSLAGSVSGQVTFEGCRLDVTGPVTITSGGRLALVDVEATVADDSLVQVGAGAWLLIEGSRLDGGRVRVLPGAAGHIRDSHLTQVQLTVRSGGFSVEEALLEASTLQIDDASPVVADVHFLDAPGPVRVTGSSAPRLVNVTFEGQVTAVQTATTGGTPTLRLEGTPRSSAWDLQQGTVIETSWFVHVLVEGTASATDTRATIDDPAGAIVAEGALHGQPAAGTFLVPASREVVGGPSTDLNPFRVRAVQGQFADFVVQRIDGNQEIRLTLPNQPDQHPPEVVPWAVQHVADRPGHSRDGNVSLAWLPATDQDHPNRAVSHYQVSQDGVALAGRTRSTGWTVNGLPDGTHTFLVEAIDLVGNRASYRPLPIVVDRAGPALAAAALGPDGTWWGIAPGQTVAHKESFLLRFETADAGTGAVRVTFQIDGGIPHPYEGPFSVSDEGNHTVVAFAQDEAGHTQRLSFRAVLDRDPPAVLLSLDPPSPGPHGWYATRPRLALAGHDEDAGIAALSYKVGAGPWTPYTAAVPVGQPGDFLLQARAVDRAGNAAITQVRVAFDPDPPLLDARLVPDPPANGWHTTPPTLHVNASDGESGLLDVAARIDEGAWMPVEGRWNPARSSDGTLAVRARDRAGNATTVLLPLHIDLDDPVPALPIWTPLEGGRVHAAWFRAPAHDATSGVAALVLESRDALGRISGLATLSPKANDHVLDDLPRGRQELRLRVIDAAGRHASSPWTVVEVQDAIAALDGPARRVDGQVVLAPPAPGDHREVLYYLDGRLLAATAQPPHTVTWDTRQENDGLHTLRTVVVGADGTSQQTTTLYAVGNSYGSLLETHALPLMAAAGAGVLLAALATATLATGKLPPARGRLALVAAGLLVAAAAALPLALRGRILDAALFTAAAAGAVLALAVGTQLALGFSRGRVDAAGAAKPSAAGHADIDFDAPYRRRP